LFYEAFAPARHGHLCEQPGFGERIFGDEAFRLGAIIGIVNGNS
jgi:hypothetical protein